MEVLDALLLPFRKGRVRKDWVTINGQHILIGEDGTPIAGNPKVYGGASGAGGARGDVMDPNNWDSRGHFVGPVDAATYDPAAIRADYVQRLGKQQISKVVEDNPQLQAKMQELETARRADAASSAKMEKLGVQSQKLWSQLERAGTPEKEAEIRSKIERLGERMDTQMVKGNESFNRVRDLNAQVSEMIAKGVREQTGAEGKGYLRIQDSNHPNSGTMEGHIQDFANFVHPESGMGEKGITIRRLEAGDNAYAASGRSFYNWDSNQVSLADNASSGVVFHEMGHWMEENTPGGSLAARSFLQTRTAGQESRPLSDYNSSYHAGEVTIKDKFSEAYVGKIYSGTRGSEITSMGMQYLKEDAASFYRMDPGHFAFTLGMISAAQKGGFPWAK